MPALEFEACADTTEWRLANKVREAKSAVIIARAQHGPLILSLAVLGLEYNMPPGQLLRRQDYCVLRDIDGCSLVLPNPINVTMISLISLVVRHCW